MRRSRTALACAATSLAVTGLVLGGTTPSQAAKPGSGSSTGVGRIFMVNPVQSSGNQGLTDQKDSATAVPASEYADAQLRNLDGSGYLRRQVGRPSGPRPARRRTAPRTRSSTTGTRTSSSR